MDRKDAIPYVKWLQDSETVASVEVKTVPTVKERVEQLKSFNTSSKDLVLGIETKGTRRLIGTVGLRDIDWAKRLAEAAIFIGDERQRDKGYGTEAMKLLLSIGFKELNLKRIQLHVDPSNLRARHVFKRVGFKKQCTRESFIVMAYESPFLQCQSHHRDHCLIHG